MPFQDKRYLAARYFIEMKSRRRGNSVEDNDTKRIKEQEYIKIKTRIKARKRIDKRKRAYSKEKKKETINEENRRTEVLHE